MDTKKLAKVIQKIVEVEVDRKTKPLLKEINSLKKQLNEVKDSRKSAITESKDPFDMVDEVLNQSREQEVVEQPQTNIPRLSKNDKINKALMETLTNPIDMRKLDSPTTRGAVGMQAQEIQQSNLPRTNFIPQDETMMINEVSQHGNEEEFRTVGFNSNMVQSVGTNGFDKRTMAEKMGYGGMVNGGVGNVAPQTGLENKPVNTAKPEVQKVINAANRDYSALMQKFKK